MLTANERAIACALLAYAKKIAWAEPITSVKRFSAHAGNAFLLGVMFDRSVKAEAAWDAAKSINDSLGDSDDPAELWTSLTKLEKACLVRFLRYGNGGVTGVRVNLNVT
jgi:hypothetical protein